ncbi:MAG TPA: hypothetical protein VJS43_06475 [Candidatus Acidoferrales bacterium]|nr:hypothetical protein [Candidatus Acidoferrales bacterium]
MQVATQGTAENQQDSAKVRATDPASERRLWLAVVVQAVEEWRNGTLRNRRLAQQFLFDDSKDFHAVCANAGLDPDNLRSKLLKIGRKVNAAGPVLRPLAA